MKRKISIIAVFFCTLLLFSGCANKTQNQTNPPQSEKTELSWQEAAPGILYDTVTVATDNNRQKDLILVKIDPQKTVFHIYQNTSSEQAKTISEIHKETGAIISFNGGFYSEEFKPTGLLLENGEILTPYQKAEITNGVFAITQENKPILIENKNITNTQAYRFAIQNGPILLNTKGEIAIFKDNGKGASRTAIGIDKDNHIVIIIMKQSLFKSDNQIILTDFAHLLKENDILKPLQLHSVLNLDGGPSSGIIIQDTYFAEFQKVQNIIWAEKK